MGTKRNDSLCIIKLLISGSVWMMALAVFNSQWLGLAAFGTMKFIINRIRVFEA